MTSSGHSTRDRYTEGLDTRDDGGLRGVMAPPRTRSSELTEGGLGVLAWPYSRAEGPSAVIRVFFMHGLIFLINGASEVGVTFFPLASRLK